MSKGSGRRPPAVSRAEFDAAWERNFGAPKPPTATERYEATADAFFRATGMLAPGKDAPAELGAPDFKERWDTFQAWCAAGRPPKFGRAVCPKCGHPAHADHCAAGDTTWECGCSEFSGAGRT